MLQSFFEIKTSVIYDSVCGAWSSRSILPEKDARIFDNAYNIRAWS